MTDDALRESPAYVLFFELARRERLAVVTALEAGLDSVALRELAIRDYAAGLRNPFGGASENHTVTRIAAAIIASLSASTHDAIPTDLGIASCLEAALRLLKANGNMTSVAAIDVLMHSLRSARAHTLSGN